MFKTEENKAQQEAFELVEDYTSLEISLDLPMAPSLGASAVRLNMHYIDTEISSKKSNILPKQLQVFKPNIKFESLHFDPLNSVVSSGNYFRVYKAIL